MGSNSRSVTDKVAVPSSAGLVRQDPSVGFAGLAAAELASTAPPLFAESPSSTKLPPAERRISSDRLFGGLREVAIEHGGQCYRLRVTSMGKLILTK